MTLAKPGESSAESESACDSETNHATETQVGRIAGVQHSLTVGALFAERFRLQGLLGRGGSGHVFEALDTLTGASVALKVFGGSGTGDRFIREGAVLAGLRHPAIVGYVDHGVTPAGERYVATELARGRTLKQVLRQGPLGEKPTAQVGLRILQALAAAHRAGIVHRDIKPENLIVVDDDFSRLTVLDFGIARRVSELGATRTGHWVGTPMYMAPEQARGQRDVDGRADLFSVGCVMLECLTGKPHFVGDNALATLAKICVEDEVPVGALCRGIHPELEAIMQGLLAKRREQRLADAAAVALRLASLLPQLESGAPPPPRARIKTIGDAERRVRALVLVAPGTEENEPEALGAAARLAPYTRGVHPLLNGALLLTVPGDSPLDQAVQAARCALVVREAMPARAICIGLGQCELVTGATGKERDLADVTTDLLAETGGGEIRVDAATAALLATRFELAEEGKGDATRYRLLRERRSLEPPRTVLGKVLPCVGRERELANLEAIFGECVSESAARAALVVAGAGAGKSRLRFELLERLGARHQTLTSLIARADPLRMNAPLGLLGEMLRTQAGVEGTAGPEAQRRRLEERLGRHLEGDAGGERSRTLAFLGELAGVRFPEEEIPALALARRDGHVMADQTRAAWLSYVRGEAKAAPMVIVLEDVHWGDGASVRALDETMRQAADLPVFVVGFARPELEHRFPGLWAARNVERMSLRPLPVKVCEALVREVFPGLGANDVGRVAARADGNPFFLEELMRAVALTRTEEGTLTEAETPPTVLGMVQARLDELGEEAKRVLRAASVFGEHFAQAGVAALLESDHEDVTRWLDMLADKEVVYRRDLGATGPAYSFRHALLRDAAYEALTETDRTAAHREAGLWLQGQERPNAALLVEHFERGGARELAARWCAEAAEAAIRASDLPATIAYAERGKALGAEADVLMRLELAEGDARCWRGEYAHAEQLLRHVAETSQGKRRYEALAVLVYAMGNQGRVAELAELIQPEAEPVDDAAYVAWAKAQLCLDRFVSQRPPIRIRSLADGSKVLLEAHLAMGEAWHQHAQGRLSHALSAYRFSRTLFEQAGDLREQASSVSNEGALLVDLGLYTKASEALRDAAQLGETLGTTSFVAMVALCDAQRLLGSGRHRDAAAAAAGGIDVSKKEASMVLHPLRAYWVLAELALGSDEPLASLEAIAREALAGMTTSCREALPTGYAALARVLRRRGALAEALEISRQGFAAAHNADITDGEFLARTTHVDCLVDAGLHEEARAVAEANARRLVARVNLLTEPAHRVSFLHNVPENAEALRQAQNLGIDLSSADFAPLFALPEHIPD